MMKHMVPMLGELEACCRIQSTRHTPNSSPANFGKVELSGNLAEIRDKVQSQGKVRAFV